MTTRIGHSKSIISKTWAVALIGIMLFGGASSVWRPRRASAGPPPNETAKAPPPKPAAPKPATAGVPVPAQAPGAARKSPLLLHFALYDAGIYPGEIHAKQGPVRLALEDYTGGTAGLMIDNADSGAHLSTVKRDRDSWRGTTDLTLHPGHYVLYDGRTPDNKASLVIEP